MNAGLSFQGIPSTVDALSHYQCNCGPRFVMPGW